MTVAKLSISLSPELAAVLDILADEQGLDRSRLIEVLLREHPLVSTQVQRRRLEAAVPPLKKGRSVEDLMVLARTARAQWDQKVATGKVRVRERGS